MHADAGGLELHAAGRLGGEGLDSPGGERLALPHTSRKVPRGMNSRKLLGKVLASPANVRFAEMQRLVEAFGFRLLRVSASHHIYGRDGISEQLNLQEVHGKAKPYQIRVSQNGGAL